MTYEEFIQSLLEQLPQKNEWNLKAEHIKFYPDGFTSDTVKDLEFIRNTNIRYHKIESDVLIGDYLVIERMNGDKVSSVCRFDAKFLYENQKKNGWESVWNTFQSNFDLSTQVDETKVFENIENYEMIKERLIIRPINYTDNRYELNRCVYKKIGDIALILYLFLYDNEKQGLGTIKVPKDAFACWNLDLEKVWEEALLNTNVMAPPRIYFRADECIKPAYSKGAFMALNSELKEIGFYQIPVITTTKQTNGAIAMFYPGVKEKLAQMAHGSYYVAFTSIHDVRIHCKGSIAPLQILRQLKQTNKAFDPAETLTRKVFYYDAEKNTFEPMEL